MSSKDYDAGYAAAARGEPASANPYAFVRHQQSLSEQRARQEWSDGHDAYWNAQDMNNGIA